MFGRALIRLYVSLLKLYPDRFRDEFSGEMGEVFNQALGDLEAADIPAARSRVEMARFYLREIWHFPASYLDARRYQQSFTAGDMPSGSGSYVEMDTVETWMGQRTSLGAALLGAIPFLLFGLAYLLKGIIELVGYYHLLLNPIIQTPNRYIILSIPNAPKYAPVVVYFIVALGVLFGVVKGFPRWSYTYLGMAFYFGWYYSNGRYYGVVYGWRAWIPFYIAILLGLLLTNSLRPLARLAQGIWYDWTRLSFALYTFAVPMFTIVFFDGDWGVIQLYELLFDTLMLAAGAVVSLRCRAIWSRVLYLQGVVLILVVKGMLFTGWLPIFDQDLCALIWSLFLIILIYFGFLLLPGVIGLIRRGLKLVAAR